MRTRLKLTLTALATAVAAAACADASANDTSEELKRDLALASSTVSLAAPRVDSALLNSMETKPQAAQAPANVVRKGPGPRAVRSVAPTVRAEVTEEVAAVDELEQVVETIQEAPAPEISEPVAVAPRPQPVVINTGGTGDYGAGNGGIYGGGMGGVIIRGGGIDGDNCELHRRGGGRSRGGIFVPQQPTMPNTGGVVVTRAPRTPAGMGSRGPGAVSRTASAPSRAESRSTPMRTARGVMSPRRR